MVRKIYLRDKTKGSSIPKLKVGRVVDLPLKAEELHFIARKNVQKKNKRR